MTLSEIKSTLGIQTLGLNASKDKDGGATDWMRNWDNDKRISISIHKDLIAEIKANPGLASLGLQSEERDAPQGPYTAKRIVKYTEAEVTL